MLAQSTFKTWKAVGLTAAAITVALAGVLPTAAQTRGKPDLTGDEERAVEALLAKMTLEEKAGQMVQLTLSAMTSSSQNATSRLVLDQAKARAAIKDKHIGSILNTADTALDVDQWLDVVSTVQGIATEETRLGVPLIYGIDSVHGANYINGGTIFPHNLTLAATWNPELSRVAGEVTAAESRSVGLNWNFSPVCDVMRTPAWSRVFETFGEDPYLASVMAAANIEGQQGDDLAAPTAIAATAKHFLGYSAPDSGRDRTTASITKPDLYDTFVPPFDAAFDSGVRTIMVNSADIRGVPVHADPQILTDLLRDELDFAGVVVTDWADVDKLVSEHRVAADQKEAAYLAVTAGIDMAMTPYTADFGDHVVELVREGRLSEERVEESARRILALKAELGLFDSVMPTREQAAPLGSAKAKEASLESARQGITLLRNTDGLLPLDIGAKILVAGPTADDLIPLHGSWSYSWQGTDPIYPEGATVLDAVRERFGEDNVTYAKGCTYDEIQNTDEAVRLAQDADVVLLCLGENPSTEQPGDLADLTISGPQMNLAMQLANTGKPVVLTIITNRPRIFTAFEGDMDAIIWTGHPGPFGGEALAEILAGDVNPSARLPFTYPAQPNELLTYDHRYSSSRGPIGSKPLFPFGAGESYTTFEYSDLDVRAPRSVSPSGGGAVEITVNVRNTGDRAGAHPVLAFQSDLVGSIVPRNKRLAGFEKITLRPGQQRRVTMSVPVERFFAYDRDGQQVFEPGKHSVAVGELTAEIELR